MVGGIVRNQNVNANLNLNNIAQVGVQNGRVDYSESIRAITSDTLVAAMGGSRPKPDFTAFGKVLIPKSTEYKAVVADLDRFQTTFDVLSQRPITRLSKTQVDELKSNLTDAIKHATDYQDKHADDPKKTDRRNAMETLKSDLRAQIGFLDALLVSKGNFPEGATMGNALAMLKLDVETGSLVTNPHKEDTLQGDPRPIGSGMMNTVYLATWKKPNNDVVTTVLKPLSVGLPEGANGADASVTLGISDEHQMVAERNVATGKVANHLGLESMAPVGNIIVFNGQTCLEMPVAPGSSPMHYKNFDIAPDSQMGREARALETTDPNRLARAGIVKTGVDENGESLFARKEQTFFAYPFASSRPNDLTAGLQEGLLNLQVLDVLTGQADRNPGNIFIDVTDTGVVVTGIDHDISFGERAGKNETDLTPNKGFPPPQWKGLPPIMMQDTFDKLMEIDRGAYETDLKNSGLNDKQVALAMKRLDGLRDHAQELDNKGLVVSDLKLDITDPESNLPVSVSDYLVSKSDQSYVAGLNRLQELTLEANIPLTSIY